MEQATTPASHLPGFWWRVLAPIGAVLVALVALIALFAALDAGGVDDPTIDAVAPTATGLLLVLFAMVLLRGLPQHERRAALAVKGRVRRAVIAGIGGGIALVIVAQAVIVAGVEADDGARRRLDELAAELGPEPWQTAITIVGLVALAPLGEELVFRALLLRALARRMAFWAAALVSSLAFAAAHIDAYVLWPRAIALVLVGLGLAWLYRRRGYLACVGAHATVNTVAAIALLASS